MTSLEAGTVIQRSVGVNDIENPSGNDPFLIRSPAKEMDIHKDKEKISIRNSNRTWFQAEGQFLRTFTRFKKLARPFWFPTTTYINLSTSPPSPGGEVDNNNERCASPKPRPSSSSFITRFRRRFFHILCTLRSTPTHAKSAWCLSFAMLCLLILSTYGHVLMSYQHKAISNSLTQKNATQFYAEVTTYFLLILCAAVLFALSNYVKHRLQLTWRNWMTSRLISIYTSRRRYYHLSSGDCLDTKVDNPDQRIEDDTRAFSRMSVTLIHEFFEQTFQVIGFAGVLWSISPLLVFLLVGYAASGTYVTGIIFGSKLIKLNAEQSRFEASFRYGLVRLREYAESIAMYLGSELERQELQRRYNAAAANYAILIVVQRNLHLFRNFYRFATYVIPSLFIAPYWFRGEVEFGTIAQTGMAFRAIFSSLNTFVSRFTELSKFSAGVDRLHHLSIALNVEGTLDAPTSYDDDEALRQDDSDSILPSKSDDPKVRIISHVHSAPILELDCLSVAVSSSSSSSLLEPRFLVRNLSLSVGAGSGCIDGGLLIVGRSGIGKSSLLRAIAGLWHRGSGLIRRPNLMRLMFIPQRPYMPLGSLRIQLLYPRLHMINDDGLIDETLTPPHDGPSSSSSSSLARGVSDEELVMALERVNLASLPGRVGGLGAEIEWISSLSLGEQQRLSLARVLLHQPDIVFLDESTSALDVDNEVLVYEALTKYAPNTNIVSVGHRQTLYKFHTHVLRIGDDALWQLQPIDNFIQRESDM